MRTARPRLRVQLTLDDLSADALWQSAKLLVEAGFAAGETAGYL
jgi:hypothetical protein